MRPDTVIGVSFLGLGLFLAASGLRLPPGVGSLPGAGFFPLSTGVLMALLACALLLDRRLGPDGVSREIGNARQVVGTATLLFGYLSLWGTGFFLIRTVVFLSFTLRFLGQTWPKCLGFAIVLTVIVYFSFHMGLNVALE